MRALVSKIASAATLLIAILTGAAMFGLGLTVAFFAVLSVLGVAVIAGLLEAGERGAART